MRQMGLQMPGLQILRRHHLHPRRGTQVAGLLGDDGTAQNLRGAAHPADAQTRCHDLRETRQVHQPVTRPLDLLRHLQQRRLGLPGKTQLAVGIILDHDELVTHRQRKQMAAAYQRQGGAGRIGEARHQVQQLGPGALQQQGFQGIGIHALGVTGNLQQFGMRQAQGLDRRRIAGPLDDHAITRLQQDAQQQFKPLL